MNQAWLATVLPSGGNLLLCPLSFTVRNQAICDLEHFHKLLEGVKIQAEYRLALLNASGLSI